MITSYFISRFQWRWMLTVLPALWLMSSCHASRKTNAVPGPTATEVPWIMKYEQGPCFGECPVYTFYLLEDHSGLLDVKTRFLDAGWYSGHPDQELIEIALLALEPEAVWTEDLRDQPVIEALPPMSVVYKHKDGLRWFSTQGKISDHFADVFRQLGYMISETRWTPSSLRPLQSNVPEPLDVIVQLKEGVDVNIWMQKFGSFGIRMMKRVAPRLNYYVVSKDPGMGSSSGFLQQIKMDPDVIGAQWDRPLTPRKE